MKLSFSDRVGIALIAGAICVVSTLWSPLLGWVAPVLLMFSLRGASHKEGFLIGACYGFAEVLEGTGAVQFGNGAVLIILCCNILERMLFLGGLQVLSSYARRFWPLVYIIGIPLSDYLAGTLATRFYAPLTFVDTQALNPYALQIVGIVGAYGLTGIMTAFGCCLVLFYESKKELKWTGGALLLLLGTYVLGGFLMASQSADGEQKTVRVLSIQGGVPNWFYEIAPWVPDAEAWIQEQYILPIEQLQPGDVDLVILPEAALRPSTQNSSLIQQRFENLAMEKSIVLVFGLFLDAESGGQTNSAVIIDGMAIDDTGRPEVYKTHKVITVPVVEKDLKAGDAYRTISTSLGTFGVLNCVESLHVLPARELARQGAQFLIVIANDAGFGLGTSGRFHAERAAVRAADVNLDVVHAGQFGFTRVYRSDGQMRFGNDYKAGTYRYSVNLKPAH